MIILLPTDELILQVVSGVVDGSAFFADTVPGNSLVAPANALVTAASAGTHILVAPPGSTNARRAVRNVFLASNNGSAATAQLRIRRTINGTPTVTNLTQVLDAAAGVRI